jgi:hypothetical protein
MKKKKVTVLASILISLPFLSLPLMGQTATRAEVQAVKPIEETRPGKPAIHEPGDWQEAGKQQLRAAARPWPDSTVTFTSAGERQGKSVYTYDAAGNQTLSEYYRWEGGAWVNSYKYVYAYDAAGHETLYEGYRWEGGAWVNLSKSVSAYDAAGHQTLYESYTWENSQWKGRSKETYAYDSRGVMILYEEYNWRNNTWAISSEYHYDRKAVNSKVYVGFCTGYDTNGNNPFTAVYIEGSGLTWAAIMPEESKMEYKVTYDANDNLTLVETTVLRDGKRVPYERHILKYSNNNPVSIEVYNYNGNDIGQINKKATNTYDARGNRTLSESYHWGWDSEFEFQKWIGYNKYVNSYDANNRVLSYESYTWDTSSGGWKGSWKYTSTFDANGRELSYESYNWDTSSGGWKGSSKTTYEERNEYGDVILRKSWSWKNSGWEWTDYTVYYPGGSGPSGTEYIGGAEPSVYIHGDMLQIQTVSAERIGVYTLDGAKVYESAVSAGTTAISAERLPKGVLIVRGSSGWARKVFAR